MRSLLALVFGAAALLAGLATLPAAWTAHNVASEGGYVSFTEPLAKDPSFNKTVAVAIGDSLISRSLVPEAIRPATSAALATAALRISSAPGYLKAWDATQRQSHRIMFDDPRKLPAELDRTDRLAVDLGPLGQFVVAQATKDLPVQLAAPKQLIVSVGGNSSNSALDQIKKTPGWAGNGLIVTAVCVALCLVIARRRALAVALLGLGVVVLAAALHGLSTAVIPNLTDRNTAPSPFAEAVVKAFADRAATSFDHWLITLAVIGVIAAIAGGAVSLGFSARSKA